MTMSMGDKAELAIRILKEDPLVAYDTETSGVNWKINHPIGYVVTNKEHSLYIPVRHGGGGNLLDAACPPLESPEGKFVQHQFERELEDAFRERERLGFCNVGHNIKFDAHFSANANIMLGRNLRDTELQEALCDEFAKSFSLENTALRRGVTAKKGDELYQLLADRFGGQANRNQMEHFWRLEGNNPVAVDYAEGDGVSTLEVYHSQLRQIEEEDLQVVAQLENDLIWTVFRMERRGIRVDEGAIEQVIIDMNRQADLIRRRLPTGFNPRSPTDIRAYLEEQGYTNWPMTAPSSKFPDGQPSFNEKWLETIPPGKDIIELRRTTNLVNSFIMPLKDRHVYDGRVHSSFNQLKNDAYGTISGRFSSSEPNMQQVPKRNKELAKIFRRLFIPEDGQQFLEADYSQCEPRLFAHYSEDPNLVRGYTSNPPLDAHQVVADMMEVERDPTAKRMNMGIFTGMQVKSFAGHMGWEIPFARTMWNSWFEAFPDVRKFQDLAKSVFLRRGYVRTLLGRRCRLDHPRFAYKGTSRIIQGGNADIIKYKMLEADRFLEQEGDDARLTLTVHDSLGGSFPLGERGDYLIAEFQKICEDVQSPPFNLLVPFKLDIGTGSNWAEATFG